MPLNSLNRVITNFMIGFLFILSLILPNIGFIDSNLGNHLEDSLTQHLSSNTLIVLIFVAIAFPIGMIVDSISDLLIFRFVIQFFSTKKKTLLAKLFLIENYYKKLIMIRSDCLKKIQSSEEFNSLTYGIEPKNENYDREMLNGFFHKYASRQVFDWTLTRYTIFDFSNNLIVVLVSLYISLAFNMNLISWNFLALTLSFLLLSYLNIRHSILNYAYSLICTYRFVILKINEISNGIIDE